MKYLLYAFIGIGISCGDYAQACDWKGRADELLSSALKSIPHEAKIKLQRYNFSDGSPEDEFFDLKELADDISRKIITKSKSCDDIFYISVFSNSFWGWQAVIHLMSLKAKGAREKDLEIVEPVIGYATDILNMMAPLPINDVGCSSIKVSSTGYYPSASKVWYRYRALSWVRCDDGGYRAYLPETGWRMATPDQITAILSPD